MECTKVCPTRALEPPPEVEEHSYGATTMGVAVVDEKICLPFNRISWCGACYTACPLKGVAIEVDYRNRPKVLDGCVGCGLCVEVCPIKYKAIAVASAVAPSGGRTRRE
jgi:epoxyqueuosine reductase QueG